MKLSSEDLMFGDWVMCYNNVTEEKLPIQLKDFMRIQLGILDNTFEPIPLTEEILEKNSSDKNQIDRVRRGEYIIKTNIDRFYDAVYIEEFDNGIFGLVIEIGVDEDGEDYKYHYELPDFKYVHELQHALRLCGLQELADNFIVE